MSKIDYTYVHNCKCALISYLESVLHVEFTEQQTEEISKAFHDVAFHEAERQVK